MGPQIQAGTPATKPSPTPPKDGGANSPGLQVSWWWGTHSQPPSVGPPQHSQHSTSAGLGICLRVVGNSKMGRGNKIQALLAVCSGTFHWNLLSHNRTFSKALVAQVTRLGHEEVLPPCGCFMQLQPENAFWGTQMSQGQWGCK